jgi:thiosulfate/3-mercaptopyruvate sulfurtransferase
MATYAHPESFVSTQWVADHLNISTVRLVEVGWDTSEYELGHIPGTVAGWGFTDIQRSDTHDIPNKLQLESMLSQAGITNTDTVVFYGGLSNLVAALAFWVLKIYGHADVRLLDGGRQKWVMENRILTAEKNLVNPTQYLAQEPNWSLRADKDYIVEVIGQAGHTIVDARPTDMYTGENKFGIERGGHIPTAINIPSQRITDVDGNFQRWQSPLTHEDGSFKSAEELQKLFSENGVKPNQTIVTYCVRGGLSTYMWFALTQLLGYTDVREYERSWAEWGNLSDTPIEN